MTGAAPRTSRRNAREACVAAETTFTACEALGANQSVPPRRQTRHHHTPRAHHGNVPDREHGSIPNRRTIVAERDERLPALNQKAMANGFTSVRIASGRKGATRHSNTTRGGAGAGPEGGGFAERVDEPSSGCLGDQDVGRSGEIDAEQEG
jgi:hypothetical protein